MLSILFSYIVIEKLFKCLHKDGSHTGDVAGNQATIISIVPSQRCFNFLSKAYDP
jgi:hypothetical protein